MIKIAIAFAVLSTCSAARAADEKVDFARDVKPILQASCVKCHSYDAKKKHKPASGLDLTNGKKALKGGEQGPDIIPGKAEDSLLYKLLQGTVKRPRPEADEDEDIAAMPKQKKGEDWKPLPKDKIETIRRWIDQGAKWSS